MKKSLSWAILLSIFALCQAHSQVSVSDVVNFWTAYDSVRSTTDTDKQVAYIDKLYIGKGSEGLAAFLRNKDNPARKWADLINGNPAFWDSLRVVTSNLGSKVALANNSIAGLKTIYPALKEAHTYILIGFRQQGGTIRGNLSLIGAEVVFGNSGRINDGAFLQMLLHEYVHTQQKRPDFQKMDVLTASIREGACDFIAEQAGHKPFESDYMAYGKKHTAGLWQVFERDRHTQANNLWVSTGNNPVLPVRDPGYYMGYAICSSYYNAASDKAKAIAEIIELDYADPQKVEKFLTDSGFAAKMKKQRHQPLAEGYKTGGDSVIFTLDIKGKSYADGKGGFGLVGNKDIKMVAVVGDFNKWDPKAPSWQLIGRNGKYKLSVPKKLLGTNGQRIAFRFVVNGEYWLQPGFDIANRLTDKEGNANLYLDL